MNIRQGVIKALKPMIDRVPVLAGIYRAFRDQLAASRGARRTQLGFNFGGNPAMERGLFEPEEVSLVMEYLNGVDVFVNVGANIGYYCCIARMLGKNVIAFEPIPMNLEVLYKNLDANNWLDVEVFPLALGNQKGLVQIYGGATGASLVKGWAGTPGSYRRITPISTLDTVLGARLQGKRCLFLVDIEGAEQRMLEGAILHLALTPKPIWIVEIATTEHQPEGVRVNPNLMSTFELFWRHGYRAWTATRKPHPVSEEDVRKIVVTLQNHLKTHNFIFAEGLQRPG